MARHGSLMEVSERWDIDQLADSHEVLEYLDYQSKQARANMSQRGAS